MSTSIYPRSAPRQEGISRYRKKLGKPKDGPKRVIMEILAEEYPRWIGRSELAGAAGIDPTSRSYKSVLYRIRKEGLITEEHLPHLRLQHQRIRLRT